MLVLAAEISGVKVMVISLIPLLLTRHGLPVTQVVVIVPPDRVEVV